MDHRGEVYARSTSGVAAENDPWMAMFRNCHARKLTGDGRNHLLIYGVDPAGVHSIEYGGMAE